MSTAKPPEVSEGESLKVAEASRQAEWKQPSFMREMFLGNFRLDLLHPYPLSVGERPEFAAFQNALRSFLVEHVDPDKIDSTGEYPEDVVDGLRKLGAFGMKIPKEYGGLGLSQVAYNKALALVTQVHSSLGVLLSAH